jgi:intracellular multiplication protein IcmK
MFKVMIRKNIHHAKSISVPLIVFFASVLTMSNLNAAADSPSAQQALEQLRMLQKRLAANNSNQPPSEAGKKSNGLVSQAIPPTPSTSENSPPAAMNPAGIVPPQGVIVTQGSKLADEDAEESEAQDEKIDDLAFKDVAQQMFPLTPEQIIRLRQIYQTNEFAQATTAGTPPKPTATSQFVNLSPGSIPPVIRLSQGFVSSLVFLDSTGAPWPITAYDLGDPTAFNIQWDRSSNTLMIQATKLYTYGNLAVKLQGLNTPVMLTLIPGQKAVDYRVDLRVQGVGPNAKSLPMEDGIPPAASDLLLHVLEGVPPDGSSRLTISGGDARAWLLHERMYVRTNLTILSPGWIGSMTSADGMHAYEMQKTPVLLVSWHGKVMQLKVEGL